MFTDITEYIPYGFALLIAIPFLVLLRQFVHSFIELKNKELQVLGIKSAGEVRVQAFERMTLFLERIKPSNFISNFDKELQPHEFVFLTEKTIQEEFEYNASQQLYIGSINWKNIVSCKDRMIQLLHSTYESLGSTATLEDFKTVLVMNYMNSDDFVSKTLNELKKELLILNFNV